MVYPFFSLITYGYMSAWLKDGNPKQKFHLCVHFLLGSQCKVTIMLKKISLSSVSINEMSVDRTDITIVINS